MAYGPPRGKSCVLIATKTDFMNRIFALQLYVIIYPLAFHQICQHLTSVSASVPVYLCFIDINDAQFH